jgi:3-oxoacyl-[acyl-carrier-protein] synthase III
MDRSSIREVGRATTQGQALPLGTDDPVIAARAVRRALAAAGRRAADVTHMVVVSAEAVSGDALAAFARRALGPHGTNVRTTGFMADAADASALAGAAEGRIGDDADLAVVVGIAADGTTEARCLVSLLRPRAG